MLARLAIGKPHRLLSTTRIARAGSYWGSATHLRRPMTNPLANVKSIIESCQ